VADSSAASGNYRHHLPEISSKTPGVRFFFPGWASCFAAPLESERFLLLKSKLTDASQFS
jgi:hypothetical protein